MPVAAEDVVATVLGSIRVSHSWLSPADPSSASDGISTSVEFA